MKAYFTILVILFSATFCFAQDYEWDNVDFIQKPNQNISASSALLAIMDNDHKIIAGRFEGSMTYKGITLTTSLYYGAFMAKLDETDSLLWIRKFVESEHLLAFTATPQFSPINMLEVDQENNFYLTLDFSDSIYVDNQLYIANTVNPEYGQTLLLKFDTNGNIVQDFYLEGNCNKGIGKIHIDENKNMYLVGGYANDTWGTTSSCTCIINGNIYLTTSQNFFLAKYDSIGNLIWINTFEGNQNAGISGFEIIADEIYISGSVYNSNIPINFGSFILTYPSNYDKGGFIAKFDTSGIFQWTKYYGVKGWDLCYEY